MKIKIFNKFDIEGIEVKDPGLRRVINLDAKLLLKSHGRARKEFAKAKVNVIERLINLLQVPGSRGKKHKIITSWNTGKYNRNAKIVIEAFEMIAEKTGKNPLAVFVQAIENASPRDGITSIEYGGARYPQAVDVSPLRRINLSVRWLIQGAYQKCFGKKKKMAEALAEEILLAADNNMEGYALQKKNEAEKQADAAR